MSIKFAGLCGVAFCFGVSAALYLDSSDPWTTEAAASEDKSIQIVNRRAKDDRLLPATTIDPRARSGDPRDGFGVLEIGGPVSAKITIKDANGRLVFELDPLRRTTVISKREPRGVPPSQEQGGLTAPKSRVVPMERPREHYPPASRLVGLGLLQPIQEGHSIVQRDAKRQASL
jgi:hypothetical protein